MNGSTTTTMNNNKFIEEQSLEFDGNDNLLNLDAQTTTTKSSVSEAAGQDLITIENAQLDNAFNEFGPETNVDAVDEAMVMSSPHSVSQEDDQMLGKEFQQLEQKEIDFGETTPAFNNNPFGEQQEEEFKPQSAAEQEYASFLKHTSGQMSEERNVFGLPKEVLGGADDDGEWNIKIYYGNRCNITNSKIATCCVETCNSTRCLIYISR